MISIRKVATKKDLAQFIDFRYELYRDDQFDVPCLFFDEMNTLRKDKNAAFDFCEAEYFMAFRDGKMVGRIAGIINHKANRRWERRTVRFGWIEFIDDREVSASLIRAVIDWGKSKGMDEIVGPMGFTDMDREGMMVEGFGEMGNMYSHHNFAYYPEHLEALGFTKDNDYMLYLVTLDDKIPDKYARVAALSRERYNLKVMKPTRRQMMKGGWAERIFKTINETYKNLYGYSELSEKQIKQYVDLYIGFADMNFITIIVDGNSDGKLVGFGIAIPSFSKALQRLRRGRLLPFGWWHLLKVLKWHRTDTVDLLLIGILPEYRAKGANALIFADLIPRFYECGFKYAEAMPQMEANEKVRSNWQYFNARQHKRMRCFKKKI